MHPYDVPTVTVDDLPADALLLDVREPEEWRHGRIDGSLHVPMNSVPDHVAYRPETLDPQRRVVVVCKMGGRSAHVAAWLNRNGFDAVNLDGGVLAWATSGRPLVADDGLAPTVV